MHLEAIQQALIAAKLDGWLFYDHHHRDPIGERILGLDPQAHITRRWYYFIPATGEPQKLVHRIESSRLDTLPGGKTTYSSWQELAGALTSILNGSSRIAMQYSPDNAIMYVSMVDAGTVEFLRGLGKEIVSSADLVSQFEAVLTAEQMASHAVAQRAIDSILIAAWQEIGQRVRPASGSPKPFNEYDMVQWLGEALRRENLTWEHGPNVSIGPNSADSHYEPTEANSRPVLNGAFLLIDIWGKSEKPFGTLPSIYYDVTWTGVIGREPSSLEQQVFTTVRDARDAAIAVVEQAFAASHICCGYQPDNAARAVIRDAGFGEYFTHRTGHNIAAELHGSGAHLDNLETHDIRQILPNTCFSVEPGIYLSPDFNGSTHPQFGIRSEINMLTAPGKAWVTGPRQQELIRI